MLIKPQARGGIIRGEAQKKEALERYLNNPNYCKQCGLMMPPNQKFSHIRKKKFCDRKCSFIFRSQNKKEKPIKTTVLKPKRPSTWEYTKGDLFKKSKNWQTARSRIRQHASDTFHSLGNGVCKNCEYEKYVEVCHIKSVSSFPDETSILEINNPENLVGLCPNCHWEFDHGLLNLEEIGCGIPSCTEI